MVILFINLDRVQAASYSSIIIKLLEQEDDRLIDQ
jgi:hypothetical protein